MTDSFFKNMFLFLTIAYKRLIHVIYIKVCLIKFAGYFFHYNSHLIRGARSRLVESADQQLYRDTPHLFRSGDPCLST